MGRRERGWWSLEPGSRGGREREEGAAGCKVVPGI